MEFAAHQRAHRNTPVLIKMNFSDLPFCFLVGVTTLVGLCVGSFLNVVIYRASEMTTLTQASCCPSCDTKLAAADLVPVASWLFLKGKCAYCDAHISARYPIVELVTAVMWGACATYWRNIESAVAWSIFCSALLSLAMIDWDTTLLPDSLTLPLLWTGLVASTLGITEISSTKAIWGAAVGYGFLWLVSTSFELATGKVGMGGGDLKLLAAIGAWLGPFACIWTLVLASLSGAFVGLFLKSKQLLREGNYIPFGPFLSGAAMLLVFTNKFGIDL